MRMTPWLAAVLIGSPAAAQQTPSPATPPAADSSDVRSVDAIIGALYDVISGPAGERNWGRFRSLFWPGARLIPTRHPPDSAATAIILDPDTYATRAGAYFQSNGFFEREAARRLERFGSIAHAFSTYESRHAAADSAPFSRGINSIQLFYDGQRWWVLSIFWDAEREGLTIPPAYLRPSGP
jgi:hypothetical protein